MPSLSGRRIRKVNALWWERCFKHTPNQWPIHQYLVHPTKLFARVIFSWNHTACFQMVKMLTNVMRLLPSWHIRVIKTYFPVHRPYGAPSPAAAREAQVCDFPAGALVGLRGGDVLTERFSEPPTECRQQRGRSDHFLPSLTLWNHQTRLPVKNHPTRPAHGQNRLHFC